MSKYKTINNKHMKDKYLISQLRKGNFQQVVPFTLNTKKGYAK